MLSLSNAFSHDELRAFDARVRKGLGLPPAPEPAPGPALRRRAQDRRPRDQPPLRARPVRPGRDPRRRHDRRGRDGQPADDRGHPGPARRARDARGARRGLHAQGRVRAHQRGARGGRPGAVRQPAQQRRGLAPPDRPGGDRRPPAVGLVLPAGRGRRRPSTTQSAALERLAALGFPVNPDREPGLDIEGVIAFTERWREARHDLPYETDGVVVKVDRFDQQARLGMVSRAPRWAIAFKFPPEQVEAFVEDIVPYVGRTGTLTPGRAHDAGQGRRLDRRPGDPPQPRRGPAQGHPDRRLGRPPEGRRRDPRGRPPDRRAADRRRARVRDARALPGLRHAGRPGRGRGPRLLPEHALPGPAVAGVRPLRRARRDGHRGRRLGGPDAAPRARAWSTRGPTSSG